jgi:sulfopyruvate decarboxylase subunit alpha
VSRTQAAESLYEGLKRGGVTFSVSLPDSILTGVAQLLQDDPEVRSVVCAREDEGVAIAAGAALAGELPVATMEASGVGLSGLILARAKLQRTSMLVVFSHVMSMGDPFDYHAASRVVGEGVLGGLGIPYEVARSQEEVSPLAEQLLVTAHGQKTVVGLGIPGWIKA